MGTVVEVIEGLEVHVMTPDGEETIMVRHHPAQATLLNSIPLAWNHRGYGSLECGAL